MKVLKGGIVKALLCQLWSSGN